MRAGAPRHRGRGVSIRVLVGIAQERGRNLVLVVAVHGFNPFVGRNSSGAL